MTKAEANRDLPAEPSPQLPHIIHMLAQPEVRAMIKSGMVFPGSVEHRYELDREGLSPFFSLNTMPPRVSNLSPETFPMSPIGTLPAGIRLNNWPSQPAKLEYAPEVMGLREELRKSVPEIIPQLEALEQMRQIRSLVGATAGPRPANVVTERS